MYSKLIPYILIKILLFFSQFLYWLNQAEEIFSESENFSSLFFNTNYELETSKVCCLDTHFVLLGNRVPDGG